MKKKNGFEQRTLAKRQQIITTARELFFNKGPAETSIADIADKAGVSQVTIYNYFKSKNGLLEIIIRKHLDDSLKKAEDVLLLDKLFKEKLKIFFSLGQDDTFSDETLKNFNWQDIKIQNIYEKFVNERQIPFLIRFIEMGKTEGAIDNKLSTEAILAYFNVNMLIYKDPDFLGRGKSYIASLSHLFYYGLLGK